VFLTQGSDAFYKKRRHFALELAKQKIRVIIPLRSFIRQKRDAQQKGIAMKKTIKLLAIVFIFGVFVFSHHELESVVS
jgi:sugar diacid utilization regulator